MTKQNNIAKRIISVFMCITLVFTVFGICAPSAGAKSLDSLRDEYSDIKDKVAASEDKIAELESQQAEQEQIVGELNRQITILNAELTNIEGQKDVIDSDISDLNAKIDKLRDEIAELDRQIAEKDEEIEETVEIFCERMRANYMAGKTSAIELLLNSTSLPSFLNRLELFRRVTQNDQDLVDELNEEIAAIKEMQDDIERKKTEIVSEKIELEQKQGELQKTEDALSDTYDTIIEKSREASNKIASLNSATKELEGSIAEHEAEMDRIDREIYDILHKPSEPEHGGNDTPVPPSSDSGWICPIPYSGRYISSPYGWRYDPATGNSKFHSGLDITTNAAYGKNIVATRSGRVILTDYQNYGYGNYLIIDHGDGYSSVYGHCKDLVVSEGQYVSQGQVIAHIGASGYATGPHVHFEIRYYGEKQNPLNYISV